MTTRKFKHDKYLFTKEGKEPIKFSMRSCEERAELSPFIRHGGGIVTGKSSPDCIRLIERGSKILAGNNISISSQYAWDCIKKNKLLNVEDYRHKPEDSDIDDNDSFNSKIVMKARKTRTRQEYSVTEELKILEFISKHHRHAEVKGKTLWKAMEELKILNRTWQSMKEHFLKIIMPRISTYNLLKEDEKRFRQPFLNEMEKYGLPSDISDDSAAEENDSVHSQINGSKTIGSESTSSKKNQRLKVKVKKGFKYTVDDDMQILQYVLSNVENISLIKGNLLWKRMNVKQITNYTWQSMKDRFLKRILPKIDAYSLPSQYHKQLEKLKELHCKKPVNKVKKVSSSNHLKRNRSKQDSSSGSDDSICLLETVETDSIDITSKNDENKRIISTELDNLDDEKNREGTRTTNNLYHQIHTLSDDSDEKSNQIHMEQLLEKTMDVNDLKKSDNHHNEACRKICDMKQNEFTKIKEYDLINVKNDQFNMNTNNENLETKETEKKSLNPRERLLMKFSKSNTITGLEQNLHNFNQNIGLSTDEDEVISVSDETENYISEGSDETDGNDENENLKKDSNLDADEDKSLKNEAENYVNKADGYKYKNYLKERFNCIYEEFLLLPQNSSYLTCEEHLQALHILQKFLDISEAELKCILENHNGNIASLMASLINKDF